jgi:hypothetical protein
MNNSNPCIRCGKERIVSKTWKEEVTNFFGSSFITHTETVCPDGECQKIVNAKFKQEKEKKEALMLEKQKRYEQSQKNAKKKTAEKVAEAATKE